MMTKDYVRAALRHHRLYGIVESFRYHKARGRGVVRIKDDAQWGEVKILSSYLVEIEEEVKHLYGHTITMFIDAGEIKFE